MGIMRRMRAVLFGKLRDEKGQTAIEYVLVIVLAVLAIVIALQAAGIGDAVTAGGVKISQWIESASTP